jgi:curved DNA-binding protein CbpA
MIDYYEFLQISPKADNETIQRVYRYLAGRLHPDNPESGDAEMFRTLKAAHDTLLSPAKRAEYDSMFRRNMIDDAPLSCSIDFMDTVEGELNRRLAVLALLYFKRRANSRFPEVSLAEIERRMGFPRDYLDFTTWYLAKKGYITRADNSDFTLTAEGVDYIETQRTNLPMLNRLLTDGSKQAAAGSIQPRQSMNGRHAANGTRPIITPAPAPIGANRRQSSGNRRHAVEDLTAMGFDRRIGSRDRRVNTRDRRQNRQDRRSCAMPNDPPATTRVQ